MRLRPSGRQGPVATSITAFRSYQQDEAWTWGAHGADARPRHRRGTRPLRRDRGDPLCRHRRKGRPRHVRRDAAEMRARLAAAGRGGQHLGGQGRAGRDAGYRAHGPGRGPCRGRDRPCDSGSAASCACTGMAEGRGGRGALRGPCAAIPRAGRRAPSDRRGARPRCHRRGRARLLARVAGHPSAGALASQLDKTRAETARIIDNVLGPIAPEDTP